MLLIIWRTIRIDFTLFKVTLDACRKLVEKRLNVEPPKNSSKNDTKVWKTR